MKRVAWTAYATVVLLSAAAAAFGGGSSGMGAASVAWAALGVIGVLGYAWRRPIGWRFVWKAYLSLCLSALAAFVVFVVWAAVQNGDAVLLVRAAAALALQAPLFYAIWAYAYRARALWQASV